MRFLVSAFLLLSHSMFLACHSGGSVRVSEEDIAEAVFRFQIERCYESNPPKVYFLALKRIDPSDEFMGRFKPNGPAVRKHSQMSPEFSDPESGERGIVLGIYKLTRISETKFEVEGGCVAGGDNGYGFLYSVSNEGGAWRVKGSRMTWIS